MSTNTLNETLEVTSSTSIDRPIVNLVGSDHAASSLNLDIWLNALAVRGVTFRLRANRLTASPWSTLTADDRTVLKEHRVAIKELIKTGTYVATTAPFTVTPKTPVVDPDAQLKERDLQTWRVIHRHDASEVE